MTARESERKAGSAAFMQRGAHVGNLPDHLRHSNLPTMAEISVRTGLKAYFSTYAIAGVSKSLSSDDEPLLGGGTGYLEAYAETVLHVHHGIELGLKEILRQKHPILASSTLPHSAVLICRMLSNEQTSFDDEKNWKSAEFREALDRVIELSNENLLQGDLSSVVENKDLLQGWNKLRNRIAHRGMFVVDYSSFDYGIATQIMLFLVRFLSLPHFENLANRRAFSDATPMWKYKKLACGIDPIDEICNIGEDSDCARKKLGYLKELGRAAYQNPMDSSPFGIDDQMIRRGAEQLAGHQLLNANPHVYLGANALLACPVCGLQTLVRYNDGAGYDTEVSCACCKFQVHRSLGNGRDYGLPIADFWSS